MSEVLALGISPVRAALLIAVWAGFAALWLGFGSRPRSRRRLFAAAWWGLAGAESIDLIILLANHIPYPAYLDLLEGTVLRHVQRLASGEALYATPSAGFVALGQNPGYYVLCLPISGIFGSTVAALRIVSALAFAGAAALIAAAARRISGRTWVAAAAVAIFLAGYQALDSALDNAGPYAVFLFFSLAAAACVDRGRSRTATASAALFSSLAFWCSQLGAVMAAGMLLFLWKRDGLRRTLLPLAVVLAVAVIPYLFLGRTLFGPQFHYFTFELPGGGARLSAAAVFRPAGYFARFWPALVLAAAIALRERTSRSVWTALLPFAWATAMIGSLHPGSSDNVFITGAVWTLLVGVSQMGRAFGAGRTPRAWESAAAVGLVISLSCLLDDPRAAFLPRSARETSAEFASMVERLGPRTYVPQFGAVPGANPLPVEAHWAALGNLASGGRAGGQDAVSGLVGTAAVDVIVAHWPIEGDAVLGPLAPGFARVEDFDERFAGMRTLRHRSGEQFPRYLYRRRP